MGLSFWLGIWCRLTRHRWNIDGYDVKRGVTGAWCTRCGGTW